MSATIWKNFNTDLGVNSINHSDGILREEKGLKNADGTWTRRPSYNRVAYEKLIYAYNKDNSSTSNMQYIIQPTGTGKSYISQKLLKDLSNIGLKSGEPVRALFLVPTQTIADSYANLAKAQLGAEIESNKLNLQCACYQGVDSLKDNHYDVIIVDEAHRVMAEQWGANLKELVANNPDAIVLGQTATPYRSTDARDIEEFFDKKPASSLEMMDAWRCGYSPIPLYAMIADFSKIRSQLAEDVKELQTFKSQEVYGRDCVDLLKEAKNINEAIELCEKDFADMLKSIYPQGIEGQKFLGFAQPGKNEEGTYYVQEAEDYLTNLLEKTFETKVEHGSIHSNISDSDKYLEKFEKVKATNPQLLCSVNMFNEGKHVKGVNNAIFMRKTESNIIFRQQMGRVLDADKQDYESVVFDCASNLISAEDINDAREIARVFRRACENSNTDEKTKQKVEKTYAYSMAVINVFDKFAQYASKKEVLDEEVFIKQLTKYREQNKYATTVPHSFIQDDGYKLGIKFNNFVKAMFKYDYDKVVEEYLRQNPQEKENKSNIKIPASMFNKMIPTEHKRRYYQVASLGFDFRSGELSLGYEANVLHKQLDWCKKNWVKVVQSTICPSIELLEKNPNITKEEFNELRKKDKSVEYDFGRILNGCRNPENTSDTWKMRREEFAKFDIDAYPKDYKAVADDIATAGATSNLGADVLSQADEQAKATQNRDDKSPTPTDDE